jgi:RNA polymerase-binding transcription factor DksA
MAAVGRASLYLGRMTYAAVARVNADLVHARVSVADLRRELAAIAESTVLVPDDEHDAEGSTIGFERARVAALLAQSQRRVADLEAAVERVRAGTYQSCERCGGDIGILRLEALSATRVCRCCASRCP